MHTTVLHELWSVESMDVETQKLRWANDKVVCRFLTVWALLLITSVLFKGQLQCYLTGLQLLIFVITYYSGIYPSLDFVQFSSVTQSCLTLRPHGLQHARLSCTSTPRAYSNSCPLSRWCHPTLLSPSPALNLSQHQGFPNESVLLTRWPKYQSFSFSISPSIGYSELISFRIDWFELLAVQVTLNSLLWNHSSKASILWCSAFFLVQLSHPYITTGKYIFL